MNLNEKYINIVAKMRELDFQKLWPNFRRFNIALYDDKNVYFKDRVFPKNEAFLVNTSIDFEGEKIGIWYLQEDTDDDILTSKLIHETFHAFQNENNESRFPNEIEALVKYRYEDINLSLKIEENKLIVKLIESFDMELFNRLVSLRKKRLSLYPYEVHYEMAIEQIEGTANYIELEALRQLNGQKYLVKLNEMKKSILEPKQLIPIRIVSYDIGALLIKILTDNKLNINYDFNDKYYFDFYLQSKEVVDIVIEKQPDIKSIIDSFFDKTKLIIQKSAKKENLVLEGDYELLGVNVYNARYLDHYIISEYFLMYKDNDQSKIIYGNFVIKIDDNNHVLEVYKIVK